MSNELYMLLFKAFSNKTRLEIINLLKIKPLTVTEICEQLNFEQSRVSHNLKYLETCGVVESEKKGKWVKYYLDKKTILPIVKVFDIYIKNYQEKLNNDTESLKQIIGHLNLALPEAHICGCKPCTHLPQFVLASSNIIHNHTCNCDACVENFKELIIGKPVIYIEEDHTCNCNACEENQRNLAI